MIELQVHGLKAIEVEPLSDLLMNLGAVSITLMDSEDCPVLEPAPGETPLWPHVELKALFQDEVQSALCEQIMTSTYPDFQIHRQTLQDCAWEDVWKTQAKAMCFGEQLWVRPSHLPSIPDAVEVILDPGLAFGTGSHPTTALCLKWLDTQQLENKTLIDYGCGTGILMIAALKLGAKFAYGVDIDPQAVTATAQNAALNAVNNVDFQVSDAQTIEGIQAVDLIIANILLNPLIDLKPSFFNHLKTDGLLVVSGILTEQIPSLVEAYEGKFEVLDIQNEEQWGLVVFQKN